MKTNEQIQLALSLCKRNSCNKTCPYHGEKACYVKLHSEAGIALRQLERERDAAVKQLKDVDTVDIFYCSHCKHEELCDHNLNSCDDCEKDCPCHTCVDMCNWQWRGVEVE